MLSLRRRCLEVAVALIGLHAPLVRAQTAGQISGVVRDATGAALPGVSVTATHQGTNVARSTTTANDGSFSIGGLAAGSYSVTASLRGFRKASQNVELAAGGTGRAELSLEPSLSEQVTVTAMKREQDVQDVPFSMAAPTEDLLARRGADTLEGVAANVGGFTAQNLGPGQSQVAIRGVSAGQIVRDQPGVKEQVGVYLDESVVSLSLFTPDLDLFDVNRVEVLRGPQGTLFGSGSLSGTVRYISNAPELGLRKWFGELGGSSIQDGAAAGLVKLGVNAPLGDKAAVRAAGYYNRLGGYVDAVQPDLSVAEDVNGGYRAGGRASVRIAASDKLTLTPRVVYQKVKLDGWNRTDAYNILANPFTTTRPRVTFGEREDFAQLDEVFTDEFLLADLALNYNFGNVALTSISSYTDRDVLVIRDATSLTASITGGSIGLPEPVYTLDAPLNDATTAKVFTQELRLSGGREKFRWVAGGFYSHTDRDYGQQLPVTGFQQMTGIPTRGLAAPTDVLFYSDLGYKLGQFALFGEGTWSLNGGRVELTGGLRYYHFDEDKEQVFDGIFGNDNNGTALVSQPGTTKADGFAPRLMLSFKADERTRLNAVVSRGFRLGGINDPLNVPLCTPADLATFGGHENWDDETAWNYEVGSKSRIFNNRGSLNLSAFYIDIRDLQATVTAGSCSSRVIFNVPKARSMGFEAEFEVAPNKNFDFALSASYNDAKLKSTVPPTAATGIVDGRRLPTVPELQLSAAVTGQRQMGRSLGYATAVYQHVGSRFTQVGDPDLGTLDLLSFAPNTIGRPLTQSTFTYDPELPSYDIVNLRIGVRREKWDVSLYANNVTDETALLSFDRERGTLARIFYLINQPRTFGISLRFSN